MMMDKRVLTIFSALILLPVAADAAINALLRQDLEAARLRPDRAHRAPPLTFSAGDTRCSVNILGHIITPF